MPHPKSILRCQRCRQSLPRNAFAIVPRTDKPGQTRPDVICATCRANPVRRADSECEPIPNPDDPTGLTMLVPLTKGKLAIIDAADADVVRPYRWYALLADGHWYAVSQPGGVLMHRLILGVTDGEVDHIDGNGLDNRRRNLRPATRAQNAANKRPFDGLNFGMKGITPSGSGRWVAQIHANGIGKRLGTFDTPEEAAAAYDAAALELRGEFARTNHSDHS